MREEFQKAWDGVEDAASDMWEEIENVLDDDEYEAYAEYEPAFRRHYESHLTGTRYPFEAYVPAYRYGYVVALHPDYRDREWDDIEPELRRRWHDHHDNPWEDVKGAIRHAWNEVRSKF